MYNNPYTGDNKLIKNGQYLVDNPTNKFQKLLDNHQINLSYLKDQISNVLEPLFNKCELILKNKGNTKLLLNIIK